MVITLHFVEEYFGFWGGGGFNKVAVNQIQDFLAELVQFGLDFLFVLSDEGQVLL